MRAVYILLVWLIAAAIVTASRGMLPLQIAVILAAGLGYARFTARNESVQHGLGVGVIWATLCIIAEMGLGIPLLGGAAAHPAFRNLLLLTWIAAPALLARRRDDAQSARMNETRSFFS